MTREEMQFLAEASVRYHKERAGHFERVSKSVTILSLLLGGGAFVTLFASAPSLAALAGLTIALLNAYRLIGKPDECAARHRDWLARWQSILGDVEGMSAPNPAKLNDWTKRRHAIEGECVVELNALKAHCFNRTLGALNRRGKPYPLKWYHRAFKNWLSFPHAFDGIDFSDG